MTAADRLRQAADVILRSSHARMADYALAAPLAAWLRAEADVQDLEGRAADAGVVLRVVLSTAGEALAVADVILGDAS